MEIPECDPSVCDRSEDEYDADRAAVACPDQARECPCRNRTPVSRHSWCATPHTTYCRQRLQSDVLASGSSHAFPRSVHALGHLIAILPSLSLLLRPENIECSQRCIFQSSHL